jgi:hypothetical protein
MPCTLSALLKPHFRQSSGSYENAKIPGKTGLSVRRRVPGRESEAGKERREEAGGIFGAM